MTPAEMTEQQLLSIYQDLTRKIEAATTRERMLFLIARQKDIGREISLRHVS